MNSGERVRRQSFPFYKRLDPRVIQFRNPSDIRPYRGFIVFIRRIGRLEIFKPDPRVFVYRKRGGRQQGS